MVNVLLEWFGFLLLIAAAVHVAVPLALLVAGCGLILIANRLPRRPPTKE